MPDSGILADVCNVIDEALGLKDGNKYRHKKSFQSLSKTKPDFDGRALIQNILCQIELNWDGRESSSDNQNWRWEEKKPKINPNNKSPEVVLERWIVQTTGNDWWNQVPVASGLNGSAGRRRAIDLVHRCGDGWYEFIELKMNEGAGTPLFAAMEILQYGVLYIFSRKHAKALGYEETDKEGLLKATGIHLKVLAPTAYYDGYDLSWLKNSINKGFDDFLPQREPRFKMDFDFETLPLIPSYSPYKWGVWA